MSVKAERLTERNWPLRRASFPARVDTRYESWLRYFAPDSVRVNVWLPTVIEPVSAVVLVLAATV